VRAIADWGLLAIAARLLLFPGPYVLVGAGCIGLQFMARRWKTGQWTVHSQVDIPMVVLGAALALSTVPSVRLDYSAPKFWGIVLGIAVFYTCLNFADSAARIETLTLVVMALMGASVVIGVLFMAHPPEKLAIASALYARVPSFAVPIQSSTIVIEGVNPNEVGGVVALSLPIALGLLARGRWIRLIAMSSLLVLVPALLMTQSRSAMVGVSVALVIATVRSTRGWKRWMAAAMVLLISAALAASGGLTSLPTGVLPGDAAGMTMPLSGRIDLWRRAAAMIMDMPVTGVGLNTFPVILHDYYSAGQVDVRLTPHAHDLFLQTAIDLGVPGLIAFGAVVYGAMKGGWAAWRSGRCQAATAALLLGLTSYGVYSLTDAIALGAKPSIFMWACLGLLAAAGAYPRRDLVPTRAVPRAPRALSALLEWTRSRPLLASCVVVVLATSLAPFATNGALIVLHGSETLAPRGLSLLTADVKLAEMSAWGPYTARAWDLDAVVAQRGGDAPTEIRDLQNAIDAGGGWDPSLADRIGSMR